MRQMTLVLTVCCRKRRRRQGQCGSSVVSLWSHCSSCVGQVKTKFTHQTAPGADLASHSVTPDGMMGSNTLFVFLIGILGGGVQLGPLGTAATNRPIVLGNSVE
jgi:hypothetical protein